MRLIPWLRDFTGLQVILGGLSEVWPSKFTGGVHNPQPELWRRSVYAPSVSLGCSRKTPAAVGVNKAAPAVAGLIAEAMNFCQKATTVSKTYASEVAGHGSINKNLSKFRGIVNGIDPAIWDPFDDRLLPRYYDAHSVVEGKAAARKALRQRLGLADRDVPVVGFVTRLTGQKGIALIKHAIFRTIERGAQVRRGGSQHQCMRRSQT